MRYLVRARVKPGMEAALLSAIDGGTLGAGSVAGDEYLRNMTAARLCDDGTARWVEVCFCAEPLEEERPYWSATSPSSACRTRTRGRSAATRRGKSRGRAGNVTARRSWRDRWRGGGG